MQQDIWSKHLQETDYHCQYLNATGYVAVAQCYWFQGLLHGLESVPVSELLLASSVAGLDALEADQNLTGGRLMTNIPSTIKRQAMDRNFQPSVRIGKTGITDNLIDEINGQLAKRKLVKIKINKGIYERGDKLLVWEHLANATSSVIVLVRGNVGVLWSK